MRRYGCMAASPARGLATGSDRAAPAGRSDDRLGNAVWIAFALLGALLAAYLGVSRQAAWNRTRRSGFPKPIAILRIGAVWATPDIVKFAKGRRRGTSHAALKAPATREPGRDVFTLARERLAALGLPVVQRTL